MKKLLAPILAGILATLYLAGCAGHEPLPRLDYHGSSPMGVAGPVSASVALEAGQSIGHSLTSYALMPGGYALPISSGPSPTGAFNTEDQGAFVENLVRVLTERGVIKLATAESNPTVAMTVKFLKTEHFPEMQDYVLDVLVTAHMAGKTYERVHHASTIDGVNLVARMFQHGIDGRRRAAEMLLATVVVDIEMWFASTGAAENAGDRTLQVARPFEPCLTEIVDFLRARYARPSTFWKDGISVRAVRPSQSVAVIELRWSKADSLPPFCLVDIYAGGNGTRIVIRERDRLLVANAHVTEALQEYVQGMQSMSAPTNSAEPQR